MLRHFYNQVHPKQVSKANMTQEVTGCVQKVTGAEVPDEDQY